MQTRSRQATSIFFVALLFLPLGTAMAQLANGNRECDNCNDLCALVDQYWQKERGIEIWKKYAASTPYGRRASPPATVTTRIQLQNYVAKDLDNELQGRTLPCKTVQEQAQEKQGIKNPTPPKNPIETGLETNVTLESCEITYGDQKLEGPTEQVWRNTHVCKGSADAELAHEQVHQKICKDTWEANRFLADKRLRILTNVAEGELQAWRRHRNRLRDQILNLAMKCGWEPTERQKNDPNAVPTEKQTKKMEQWGWTAFNALTGTSP